MKQIQIVRILAKFKKLLQTRMDKRKTAGDRTSQLRRANRSKRRILKFFVENGRWPNRRGTNVSETKMGTLFENYMSKESLSYDSTFRRIAMATGRKTNNKRAHNIQGFREEIIAFVKENGRVPSTSYEYQKLEGEACLRHKLDYYTKKRKDMSLLGIVYASDPCHLSGIPVKYRPLINQFLMVEKPLCRIIR